MASINNTSFEDEGAAPGEAASWGVSLPSGAQDIAEFSGAPYESFEVGFDNDGSQSELELSNLIMCLFATHAEYQGGFMPRETFEFGWMEPQAPNYYGAPWNHDSRSRFDDESIELGPFDTFEDSWSNEGAQEGLADADLEMMDEIDSFETAWGAVGAIDAFTWPADPAQLEFAVFGGADQENFSNGWTETFPA